ncbi:MAG: Bug family tripartite tricarboxylate transporter substrate binding protein [Lautropia sp.]
MRIRNMQSVRAAIARLLGAAALVAFASTAAAQASFPSKPMRVITPFPPGGNTNTVARLVADRLAHSWGQQAVVENRPGGNTVIGTGAVAKATPDGYTILITTNAHAVMPLLASTPYDAIQDFAPVATVARGEWVLAAHPSVPANNLRELIALAKARPDELNYASSGSGGASHLATELFNMMAGVKMQHIPYKGGGPALPDLLGGRVQLTLAVPSAVIQHINGGRLKAIAVSGESRLPELPNVPTFTESGLPGFDAGYWIGVLVPAGTPPAVVEKMSAEICQYLAQPETREKIAGLGAQVFVTSPEQFGALLRADAERFGKVIRTANIKLE